MRARSSLAVPACVIAFAAALVAPVLDRDPAASQSSAPSTSSTASPLPSATPVSPLAPVSLDSIPAAQSTGPYPRLLGTITTNAACSRFVEHYNVAVVTIIANDERISNSNTSLNDIQGDYYRRDGALKAYDHRIKLMADVTKMLDSIPVEQGAVNDLLAQAKQTTDPARQSALQESASQLQKSIDRQRAVANDLASVVRVLMDKHTSEDTLASRIGATLPLGETFNLNPGDDPVPQPGDGPLLTSSGPRISQTTVQDVMQFSRQQSIIRTAETRAVTAASKVVTGCVQTTGGQPAAPSAPASSPQP